MKVKHFEFYFKKSMLIRAAFAMKNRRGQTLQSYLLILSNRFARSHLKMLWLKDASISTFFFFFFLSNRGFPVLQISKGGYWAMFTQQLSSP